MTLTRLFPFVALAAAALFPTACAGPGITPADPSLPPDPQVYGRGVWQGTAINATARMSGSASLIISTYDPRTGAFSGAMQVDAPQVGSGPVSGTLKDGRVSILFSPPLMEGSHFTGEGVISGDTISAAFEIPAWRGFPRQKGTYSGKFYPVNDAQISRALTAANTAAKNDWKRAFPHQYLTQNPAPVSRPAVSHTAPEPSAPTPRAPARPQLAFTYGSSMTEVVAIMGEPDTVIHKEDRALLYFGRSSVTFTDDRVTGWINADGKLKVRWTPSQPPRPKLLAPKSRVEPL